MTEHSLRFPLMALAALSLLAALWSGLARLGWDLPLAAGGLKENHGPLMVVGFLGTLISLERAVALKRVWPYGAPLFAALSSLSLLIGLPLPLSQILAVLAGPRYDAMLHSIFLGFVFSMIFAHAPIIFPSITGLPMPFQRAFYLHLGLLHVSLVLRVGGDLSEGIVMQRWGGLLNALTILLFLANNIRSVRIGNSEAR